MPRITGFKQANLKTIIQEAGEEKAKEILSGFSCPLNRDIEDYAHHKAIEFSKRGFSATHLVFTSFRDQVVLVGFYALANKSFSIKKSKVPSANWRRRLNNFATLDQDIGQYILSMPLIGQIGKNYANGYDRLISGDELLKMACDKIEEMQYEFGGKMAYLECEDQKKLVDFYEANGFYRFMNRNLDKDEKEKGGPEYYVQMLKYFQ